MQTTHIDLRFVVKVTSKGVAAVYCQGMVIGLGTYRDGVLDIPSDNFPNILRRVLNERMGSS